jgi:DDE family transposase
MDQGRKRRDQVDAAIMSVIRRQRRPSPASHALAYNLGNFLRTLATPEPIKDWSLTSLKEKLIKIGAKIVSHCRYVAFQMAEVATPRNVFADILQLIAELRPPPDAAPA